MYAATAEAGVDFAPHGHDLEAEAEGAQLGGPSG